MEGYCHLNSDLIIGVNSLASGLHPSPLPTLQVVKTLAKDPSFDGLAFRGLNPHDYLTREARQRLT